MDQIVYQTYDDGSTLTFNPNTGYTSATNATDNVNAAVSGWSPGSVTPGATTWEQVLQMGITRTIDAVTRPAQLTNTQPVLLPGQAVRYNAGLAPSNLQINTSALWLGALAVVAFLAFGRGHA